MRSRTVFGGVITLGVLVIAVSCRQSNPVSEVPQTVTGNVTVPPQRSTAPPQTWPGLPAADDGQSVAQTVVNRGSAPPDAEPPEGHAGQTAVITAQDPNSEVNVRSLPSPEADSIGYGRVGDTVTLGRSEVAEDGYTWYYVTFQQSTTVGWIRSDFLDIPSTTSETETATDVPQKDLLKEAMDEHCGGPEAIAAYFLSQHYTMYLCQVRGQLRYVSQEKGTRQIIVVNDVQPVGGGYIIENGNYEYRLDSSAFTVVRLDDEGQEHAVLQDPIIHSERY